MTDLTAAEKNSHVTTDKQSTQPPALVETSLKNRGAFHLATNTTHTEETYAKLSASKANQGVSH